MAEHPDYGTCRSPKGRRVAGAVRDGNTAIIITCHDWLLTNHGECVWCGREAWQGSDNPGYFQVPIQTPQKNTDKEAQ
jgi:hypothetical protein